jgi:hypothetical protein
MRIEKYGMNHNSRMDTVSIAKTIAKPNQSSYQEAR